MHGATPCDKAQVSDYLAVSQIISDKMYWGKDEKRKILVPICIEGHGRVNSVSFLATAFVKDVRSSIDATSRAPVKL